ncbi:hypothetical protein [Methylobacterium planeticum]|uniref:Uncharacterized protein n=1 Tax=Methylobacterium planeticum TaxID=2615211 RepID=A0A6N6MIX0_9HYPH|nr:hypothetical protein [Methylobacterium planeticum]KAB1068754.1 hypothetical protein F6X51_26455 [Methylobacterium planeticum]
MSKKRVPIPKPKPGKLYAQYGRPDQHSRPSVVYVYDSRNMKCDSRVLMTALEEAPVFQGRTLCQELELRGYDITTLRFSIERRPE